MFRFKTESTPDPRHLLLRLSWDDSIAYHKTWNVLGVKYKVPFQAPIRPGFMPSIFDSEEWKILDNYCSLHQIRQKLVINTYLRFEAALNAPKHPNSEKKLLNRISYQNLLISLCNHSIVMSEIADIFIPSIFDISDLNDTDLIGDASTCSFISFFIGSHQFTCKSKRQIIIDFLVLAILGHESQVVNISHVRLDRYLLCQTIALLHESFKVSDLFQFILERIPNDLTVSSYSLSIDEIANLGIRYPLLFYPLVAFKKSFQRQVFGKSSSCDSNDDFMTHSTCMEITAKHVMIDFLTQYKTFNSTSLPNLSTEPSDDANYELTKEDGSILLDNLGYKTVDMLKKNCAISSFDQHQNNDIVYSYDAGLSRYFKWNVTTGLKTWLTMYTNMTSDGLDSSHKDDSFRIMVGSNFYSRSDVDALDEYEQSGRVIGNSQAPDRINYSDYRPKEYMKPTKMGKKRRKFNAVMPSETISQQEEDDDDD